MIKVFWQTRGLKSNTPISTEIFMLSTVIRTIYSDKKKQSGQPPQREDEIVVFTF